MTIPAGWKDDGTTLSSPNGHKVVKGFREYILSHPWSATDQPQEEEQPFQTSHSSQIFIYSVLTWDDGQGVKQQHAGQVLLAFRNGLVGALNLALAQIKQVHI